VKSVSDRCNLRLRFIGNVDRRLRSEMRPFAQWLRRSYAFPSRLEIRLVNQSRLMDDDGVECAMRYWQSVRSEAITAEIAVGTFARNFKDEGPTVAYPTVVAAVGRVLKHYEQLLSGAPLHQDPATSWGDRLLDAYVRGEEAPQMRTGNRT
jgi:hypothetical protein